MTSAWLLGNQMSLADHKSTQEQAWAHKLLAAFVVKL